MKVKSPQDPQARTRRKLDLSLRSKCQVFNSCFRWALGDQQVVIALRGILGELIKNQRIASNGCVFCLKAKQRKVFIGRLHWRQKKQKFNRFVFSLRGLSNGRKRACSQIESAAAKTVTFMNPRFSKLCRVYSNSIFLQTALRFRKRKKNQSCLRPW